MYEPGCRPSASRRRRSRGGSSRRRKSRSPARSPGRRPLRSPLRGGGGPSRDSRTMNTVVRVRAASTKQGSDSPAAAGAHAAAPAAEQGGQRTPVDRASHLLPPFWWRFPLRQSARRWGRLSQPRLEWARNLLATTCGAAHRLAPFSRMPWRPPYIRTTNLLDRGVRHDRVGRAQPATRSGVDAAGEVDREALPAQGEDQVGEQVVGGAR